MTELMTIEQVAEFLNASVATVRWWIAKEVEIGPLSARIGRRRMFRRADVEKWLDDKFSGAA